MNKTLQTHYNIFEYCNEISKKSKCLSRQVGAVLVKDGLIVSQGYNRVPCKTNDCKTCIRHQKHSGEALDICKAIHAEEACILNYLKNHTLEDLKDCTLYVTVEPCYHCAKFIIDCKIRKVYAHQEYNSDYTKAIFKEAGVKFYIV